MYFYRTVLFLQGENLCDKDNYEDEHEEKYHFSDFVEKYSCHAEEEGKRVDKVANKILGHPHVEEAIVEVMDTISRKWIFLVIQTHEYDIEGIYEIHSEHRRNGRNLSSGDDGKSRYHKGDEHGPRLSEQNKRLDAIQPAYEYRWDKDRETQEHENRIDLRRGGGIHEIELECQYCHNQQRHERKSRSESRYSV